MKHISGQNALIAGFALLSLAYYIKTTVGELRHPTTFDDAYMITRYAKHWLAGEGFSWNSTDGPAYGITSPAYLIVVTVILGLTGCSDAVALTGASFTAGLLSSLTLVLLGFFVQERKWSQKLWIPLLAVPYLLLMPPFRYHSITGMETTFSLLSNSLLACSIVIATRRRSTPALLLCLFSGALSFAARPDNGIYALFLPPLFFLATDRSLWRYSVRYALYFSLIVGSNLIVNRFLFGDFLPLPYFAKRTGFYQGYVGATDWNAMEQMLLFWTAALPCLVVLVSMASKKTFLQLVAIAVAVVATFGYYATVTQIMGYQARYYYPSIAFCFLAAFTLISSDAVANPTQSSHGTIGWRFLVGLVVLLPLLSVSFKELTTDLWKKHWIGTPVAIQSVTQYRKPNDSRLPPLNGLQSIHAMSDLLKRMPQGVVLAASEHGLLGSEFPDLTIVDLVGLHDRTIAHRGFSAAYVLSREPDLIWFPHSDYTHAKAQILDNPAFVRDYDYFPEAYRYGIALRKKSDIYTAMKYEAEREFSRIYPGLRMSDYMAEPVTRPDKE